MTSTVSAQGLQFTGGHHPIEDRSSLEVFHYNQVTFNDNFRIAFALELPRDNPIGYILRIKSKEQDQIFNLHYDEEEGNAVFRLNDEGRASLITAKINQQVLHDMHWFPLQIHFDLINDRITLTINDQSFSTDAVNLNDQYTPLIFFGKSDYLIDVLSIAIRDLSVGNDETMYRFPLREHTGERVHDERGNVFGKISNPKWLINDSYYWKKIGSYTSATEAGSDYSEQRKEVYYFNRDSILIYNLQTKAVSSVHFNARCPVKLVLGNSFVDEAHGKLYVYETYYEDPYEGATVASLDLNTYTWKIESYQNLGSELHHHSYFFDPQRGNFTTFGGYGNMSYSNQFHVYNLDESSWTIEESDPKAAIIPRYFSSAGMSADQSEVLLFGGMGNEAGKHVVGRKYFYDLYSLDLNKKQVQKRWELSWDEPNIVPARGIIVPDTNAMYVLGYPEHLTNSNIKLYRFALTDGQYEILGDSIPIYSDRISTRAKLYYDKNMNQLLTLVQESPDDVSSTLTLYVLDFPPISAAELGFSPQAKTFSWLYLITGIVILASGLGVWQYRRRLNSLPPDPLPEEAQNEAPTQTAPLTGYTDVGIDSRNRKNSIFLFGDFTVVDRQGKDITHLFSARLKQTLCLLLFYIDGGISSKLLSHTLWPYKPKEKVKTSRNVTLNHLRKVLAELDGVEVIYEKGHFCLKMSDECYCDYSTCLKMISDGKIVDNQELLNIVSRGKFLLGEDQSLFDPIKDGMESRLTPILLQELQNHHQKHQYVKTIQIADLIFEIDPINDRALAYSIKAMMSLKLDTKAKNTFNVFLEDYKQLMGEEFLYGFNDLLERNFMTN